MISKITPRICICDVTDVVDGNSGTPRIRSESLNSFGITCVINIMESCKIADIEGKLMAEQTKFRYIWSPVPVDCAGCENYASRDCNDCLKKPGLRNSKFIKGLSMASDTLATVLSRTSQGSDISSSDRAAVLIHCTAGIDRSPFVVAKYLSGLKIVPKASTDKDKAVDFVDVGSMSKAYAFIKLSRPSIYEHPEWIWWDK